MLKNEEQIQLVLDYHSRHVGRRRAGIPGIFGWLAWIGSLLFLPLAFADYWFAVIPFIAFGVGCLLQLPTARLLFPQIYLCRPLIRISNASPDATIYSIHFEQSVRFPAKISHATLRYVLRRYEYMERFVESRSHVGQSKTGRLVEHNELLFEREVQVEQTDQQITFDCEEGLPISQSLAIDATIHVKNWPNYLASFRMPEIS